MANSFCLCVCVCFVFVCVWFCRDVSAPGVVAAVAAHPSVVTLKPQSREDGSFQRDGCQNR